MPFFRSRRRLLAVGATCGALLLAALHWWPHIGRSALGAQAPQLSACIHPAAAASARYAGVRPRGPALRAVTYNLHSGLGPDFALWRSRAAVEAHLRHIAADIVAAAPADAPVDVVGLNEVDFHSRRSGWLDEARFLAEELTRRTGYTYHAVRGETWRRDVPGLEVRFGNAVLVRHPVLRARACILGQADCSGAPAPVPLPRGLLSEPRGVIALTVEVRGHPLDVLVTHLDAFNVSVREAQAAELIRQFVVPGRSTLLLGDSNAVPVPMTVKRPHFAADRTHDVLSSGPLADVRSGRGRSAAAWATFPAAAPRWPLDMAFASMDLVPTRLAVIGAQASDHRGLYVRLGWVERPSVLATLEARQRAERSERLERLLACDVRSTPARERAKAAWLAAGTGFLEAASAAQRASVLALLGP